MKAFISSDVCHHRDNVDGVNDAKSEIGHQVYNITHQEKQITKSDTIHKAAKYNGLSAW